jgi:hypothetical protein
VWERRTEGGDDGADGRVAAVTVLHGGLALMMVMLFKNRVRFEILRDSSQPVIEGGATIATSNGHGQSGRSQKECKERRARQVRPDVGRREEDEDEWVTCLPYRVMPS